MLRLIKARSVAAADAQNLARPARIETLIIEESEMDEETFTGLRDLLRHHGVQWTVAEEPAGDG